MLILMISLSAVLLSPTIAEKGSKVLDNFPLIDGHNDLPHNLFKKLRNRIEGFKFETNLSLDETFGFSACQTCHTDLVRLKAGKVGAQFWVAYVLCKSQFKDAVPRTLEQIDVIKRLVRKYSKHLELATSSDDILRIFRKGKIASLIGVEGGHSIDYKLSLLRMLYDLGARYLTLTHVCNLPWADTSFVDHDDSPLVNLTEFGRKIVREMNRLGMIVDLSHVSKNVMRDALEVTKAPVMFSHSSAYALCPHHRNVRDEILEKLKLNKGVIMVNFFSRFLAPNASILHVTEHINHIVDVAGVDSVGIGSDFDGVSIVPKGLEDVSKFPNLFDLLKTRNPQRWTDENLEKLAGRNFIRVFQQVEKVRDEMSELAADETPIPERDLKTVQASDIANCIS